MKVCGIIGWYERHGRPVDPRALQLMGDALIHRGPDGSGLWIEGSIGLGHRRLAIRDLSENGRQPMCDPSLRVFVTYNGEIYNDRELRVSLEREYGFRFRTSCDTEILPYAYLAWGERMFDRLEGIFAIGLWDRANKRLLLARDGIGVKPLYFSESDNAVLFASEIKGLLAHGAIPSVLEAEALHTYFAAGHAGTKYSLLKGIEQVAPGTVLTFSQEGRAERQFWAPRREPEVEDIDTALVQLSSVLDDVVLSQLVSDVPLGVLQSGGIDSTIVSLTLARQGVAAPLFTAAFDEKSHDETEMAARIAAVAGLPHRVVPVDGLDVDSAFRAVVHHFDGQCADTGALAFYRLSQAVRRHTTVVLSGDGGDEFFCGYETYAASRIAAAVGALAPASIARTIGRFTYRLNPANESRLPASALLTRFALGLGEGGLRPHLEWRRLMPSFVARRVYGQAMRELASQTPYHEYASYYDAAGGQVLDRAMVADQRFHLQSVLAKVDAMSMAHSLEVRVPLLDRRVMELAGRISARLLHPSLKQPKYLLRRLAERLGTPHDVATARKRGFNVPISRLLRGPLRSLADRVLDDDADVLAPYLRPDEVRALWRSHRDRKADHAFALWPVLTLATWRAGLSRPERSFAAGEARALEGIS